MRIAASILCAGVDSAISSRSRRSASSNDRATRRRISIESSVAHSTNQSEQDGLGFTRSPKRGGFERGKLSATIRVGNLLRHGNIGTEWLNDACLRLSFISETTETVY